MNIEMMKYIPSNIATFPKFDRKDFIKKNIFPTSKYTYITRNKHALVEIEGESPFNPSKFQRLERYKLPYFRGSCTFWCLWYIEYREKNKEYDRKFLENYALLKLRKRASEYITWWIHEKLIGNLI